MKKVVLILTLSSLLSSSITGSPEGLVNSHCLWLIFKVCVCVCVGGKAFKENCAIEGYKHLSRRQVFIYYSSSRIVIRYFATPGSCELEHNLAAAAINSCGQHPHSQIPSEIYSNA